MSVLWLNGEWVDAAGFHPSATDRGWTHGLGLFETMRADDGRLAFADRHLARLAAGCHALLWPVPWSDPAELATIAAALLARNGLTAGPARVRLAVSGGSGPLADLTAGADRAVWLSAAPLAPAPAALAVTLSPWPRNERGALAGLKCACYAENLLALDHARRAGCDEALFFNTSGLLCEAATANVFLIRDGELLTPDLASGCLPGITRGVILEISTHLAIPCREIALTADDLASADGMFLTSTLRGPVPVTRLDSRALAVPAVLATLLAAWHTVAADSIRQPSHR